MLLGKKQSPDRPRVSQKLSCTHGRPFNGSPSAILVSPVGAVSLRRGVGASVGRKGCSRVVDCPPLLALVGWCRRQCARLPVLAELSPSWVCHTAHSRTQRAAHINARQQNRENPGGRPELHQGQGQRRKPRRVPLAAATCSHSATDNAQRTTCK